MISAHISLCGQHEPAPNQLAISHLSPPFSSKLSTRESYCVCVCACMHVNHELLALCIILSNRIIWMMYRS